MIKVHYRQSEKMDLYQEYFNMQVGGGYTGGEMVRGGHRFDGGVGGIYIGSPYQRGHGGIGSFLAGIFRQVLPLFSRGDKAVGKEAVRTGMNIMSDVTTGNTPIKELIRNRFKESDEILKRKAEEKLDKLMEGSGYKLQHQDFSLQLQFDGASVTSHRCKKKKKSPRRKNKKCKPKTPRKGKSTKKSTRQKKKRTTRDIFD